MAHYEFETGLGSGVAGMDEVGRGPLAGPVLACCFVFLKPPEPSLLALLDDSKKLSAKKRDKIFALLEGDPDSVFGIGAASVREIEKINIRQATHLAMRRAFYAVSALAGRHPEIILVDGNDAPSGIPARIRTIVGGDGLSASIAAASIMAKVVRDKAMRRLGRIYAGYGWEKNAGYGTAAHRRAIIDQGLTPHHRRNFEPVRSRMMAQGGV